MLILRQRTLVIAEPCLLSTTQAFGPLLLPQFLLLDSTTATPSLTLDWFHVFLLTLPPLWKVTALHRTSKTAAKPQATEYLSKETTNKVKATVGIHPPTRFPKEIPVYMQSLFYACFLLFTIASHKLRRENKLERWGCSRRCFQTFVCVNKCK